MNPTGTPILAVADGTVVFAGDDLERLWGAKTDFYGNLVIIELDRRYRGESVYCLYGHLSEILVDRGDTVKTGQTIAKVGMTGIALGPHLHFEVRVGGITYEDTRNPELWLKPFRGYGTIAGRVLTTDGCAVANLLLRMDRIDGGKGRYSDVYTYLKGDFNFDDEWQENFLAADAPAGRYRVSFVLDGQLREQIVDVEGGKTSWIEFEIVLAEE